MKKIFILITTVTFISLSISCETEAPKPENPIFSDVQKMEVTYVSGTKYAFSELPDYVKYIQVLIFDNLDQPVVNDNDKIITNISDLDGGNITGLSGISRSYVESFYDYVSGEFDTLTTITPLQADDWFVVLGFDADLNLTHASPLYQVSDL